MSETETALSLADRARRLAALARAKRETESNSQDQVRFEKQLDKLNAGLGALKTVLATHRHLEVEGVPVTSLPDLLGEPRDLRDQVTRIGRPTWQYISTRATSVARTHAAVTEADTASWKAWAQNRVDSLPLALVPRLGSERSATEARVKSLRSLAGSPPSLGGLGQFRMLIGLVEGDLARVETSGVDAVLDRFVQRRILLADLSDDELALLRSESALHDQLYVCLL